MPQLMPLNWIFSFCMIMLIFISGVMMYSVFSSVEFEMKKTVFDEYEVNWWW